jgi:prepilin-type N-terminal cleavage/methylation domain-containing protein
MSRFDSKGFTLIELLIVVGVIGVIGAIAVPGLVRARMAGNEASAIGSLRTINSAQQAYSTSCANGMFAVSLVSLVTGPAPGSAGFISPDLGSVAPVKSGYIMGMDGSSDGVAGTATDTACNGITAGALHTSYYATAIPVAIGASGARYFWTNRLGAIYEHSAPIGDTVGDAAPAAGPAPLGK